MSKSEMEDYYNETEADLQRDEEMICSCGGELIYQNKTYENSDADGNRGIWVKWFICNQCQEEFGRFSYV